MEYETFARNPLTDKRTFDGDKPCYEGIVFYNAQYDKERRAEKYLSQYPLKGFCVNFYDRDYTRGRELYAVNREDFLAHMALWGVHIENLPLS